MFRHLILSCTSLCLPLAAQNKTPAQAPGKAAKAQAPAPQAPEEIRRLDSRLGRAVFRACDANGDDRIDALEAGRNLPDLAPAPGNTGFARLDLDQDGFLSLHELRQLIRRRLRAAGRFRFRAERPFRDPKPKRGRRSSDPNLAAAGSILRMTNSDQNPEMSLTEFGQLLRLLNQPATLAATFPALDTDRSGGLGAKEIAPLVRQLPFLRALAAQAGKQQRGPATPVLSKSEALRRMHPSLARWHGQLLRSLPR